MLVILATLVIGCYGSPFEFDTLEALLPRRRSDPDPNLNSTYFPNLLSIEMNSTRVSESKYPWIARVVHSTTNYYPHVCTATCIHARIFITSYSCIYNLKIKYTSVIYNEVMIPALAFVLSKKTSKQMFDDIGFIVVVRDEYNREWSTIDIVNKDRYGEGFQWFADWNLGIGPTDYKVVGYATDKLAKPDPSKVDYYLCSLDVVINIDLCAKILSVSNVGSGYYVPCYHSCTVQEFNMQVPKCEKYHGVEGGAVIDAEINKLLGVATWSASSRRVILPVGFAVPNSNAFYKNYDCAMKILEDKTTLVARRYFQNLCEED